MTTILAPPDVIVNLENFKTIADGLTTLNKMVEIVGLAVLHNRQEAERKSLEWFLVSRLPPIFDISPSNSPASYRSATAYCETHLHHPKHE